MTDQRPIGYWLKLVDRLIDESFEGSLDEHGITRRQWQLLNLLGRGPAALGELDAAVAPFLAAAAAADARAEEPAAPTGVADAPSTPGGTTSTTAAELAELVESDWVAVAETLYALTPRGQQSFERLTIVVEEFRGSMAEGVAEADYTITTATLERMARNLGWSDQP